MNFQTSVNSLAEDTKQELSSADSAQIIKSVTPKHPALNRLHNQLKAEAGTAVITSYDRMHHRHSRS